MTKDKPDTPSSDYAAMAPYWKMSNDLLAGTAAVRAGGELYLPRFNDGSDGESVDNYKRRLRNAKYTNIYGDITSTLASKPFEKELSIVEPVSPFDEYQENIDGSGNHLHAFCKPVFRAGISDGISWIMVDSPKKGEDVVTLAQEKAAGIRPYWLFIPAQNVIAVYSEKIGGREILTHFRIQENAVKRDGYGEVEVKRIREIDRDVEYDDVGKAIKAGPPLWTLWEEVEGKDKKKEWIAVDDGVYSVGEIPCIPFVTGERKGKSWRVKPPLEDVAYLQVNHYQHENGLENSAVMTCFPMLSASGVDLTDDEGKALRVPVGPMRVLSTPPVLEGSPGKWEFIETAAQSLSFVSEKLIKGTEQQMRELGRQPLTAQSGNITTVTAAFAGDKAKTVIEAWALGFKDAVENALKLTAKYINSSEEPDIQIHTDYGLGLGDDTGVESLEKARERGDLSQETYWSELKRRNTLSDEFTAEAEKDRLAEEMPGDADEDEEGAAIG